jgi:hypothetical protein
MRRAHVTEFHTLCCSSRADLLGFGHSYEQHCHFLLLVIDVNYVGNF